jgi:hypothetical protein
VNFSFLLVFQVDSLSFQLGRGLDASPQPRRKTAEIHYVVPNFRTAGMKQGGCFLLIFVNLVRQERGSIYSYRSVVQENLVLTRMVVQNEKRAW